MSIPPLPFRERIPVKQDQNGFYAEIPRALIKWLSDLRDYVAPTAGILWSAISKSGSNLTDLITRKHTDLQDLNTTNYSHPTALQLTGLTNGGDTILHYHSTDRARANHTGTQALSTISDAGDSAGLDVGTSSGTVAAGDHNHTGVYEPADATILKDADIGVSVQAYDADITTVSASQAEMEAGTEVALRSMSPLRVAQAIAALGGGSGPAFRAYATGTTSVTGGGYAKIALAGEDFDTDSAFDATTNYRFQPTVAGYYQINASVYFASASYVVVVQVRKSGSGIIYGGFDIATRAAACSDVVYMNGTTDYLELFAFSATTQNASASQSATYMSGIWIRP